MRLEILVFLCGALCMAVEMVGARLLAPYVGTSALVWTSLIGVMLAFLALGAWMGGKRIDRNPSPALLALMLSGAGVGCLLTAAYGPPLGRWFTNHSISLPLAALACATAILAIPAFFFGMIPPCALRLRIASLADSGATIGRFSALSTIGSILGTFLGGVVLISYFPSRTILWGIAAILFALSLSITFRRPWLRLMACLCCLVIAYQNFLTSTTSPQLIESPYNSIRILEGVEQHRPVRLMATDPGYAQSGFFLDDPAELCFPYTHFYRLGPHFVPEARSILMLGGGGYSVPKWLLAGRSALPAIPDITVVELDPAMTRTAKRFFHLKDHPQLHIYHADARTFLQNTRQQYDLIFVDVFTSQYSVPFHMGTIEAAQALRHLLPEHGMLLMNIIAAAKGPNAALVQAIYNAFRVVFPEVHLYCVGYPEQPERLQNVILAAFPRKHQSLPYSANTEIAAMLASRCYSCEAEAPNTIPPLRDDFAPVERYTYILAQ